MSILVDEWDHLARIARDMYQREVEHMQARPFPLPNIDTQIKALYALNLGFVVDYTVPYSVGHAVITIDPVGLGLFFKKSYALDDNACEVIAGKVVQRATNLFDFCWDHLTDRQHALITELAELAREESILGIPHKPKQRERTRLGLHQALTNSIAFLSNMRDLKSDFGLFLMEFTG